jgi:hypothetical protein
MVVFLTVGDSEGERIEITPCSNFDLNILKSLEFRA